MREPLSYGTAFVLTIPAVAALRTGHPALALALILLIVGTAVFHLLDPGDVVAATLDHAGMIATILCLAALPLGVGWEWVGLVLGVVATLAYSWPMVFWTSGLILLTFAATGRYLAVGIGLGLIGVALLVRFLGDGSGVGTKHEVHDSWHAVWHVLAAAAFTALILV